MSDSRRKPQQDRARQTVSAILQAVLRIVKREGMSAITTNHIAEVAGVSIGSVYQYFPDKQAIFTALHQQHLDEVDRVIGAALMQHASSSLEVLVGAIVEAMVELHAADPEMSELLAITVPDRADGTKSFATRLHGAFRLAIASRMTDKKSERDLDKMAFVVTHIVDALCHGAALRRPPGLSLKSAKEETVRAVLAYLHAER